jgi:hypothetical protein
VVRGRIMLAEGDWVEAVNAPSLDPKKLLEETTPGPWKFEVRGTGKDERWMVYSDDTGEIIGLGSRDNPNAALIAAAPDLARRLAEREEATNYARQTLLDYHQETHPPDCQCGVAEAIVALAKGEG